MAAIAAAPASGAATRVEYATQANAICAGAQGEAEQLFGKIGRKPKALARALDKLVDLYERTTDSVAVIVPAPGDEALAASWIGARRETGRALDSVGDATRGLLRVISQKPSRLNPKKVKRLVRIVTRESRDLNRSTRDETTFGNQLGVTSCVVPAEFL